MSGGLFRLSANAAWDMASDRNVWTLEGTTTRLVSECNLIAPHSV